ELAGQFHGIDMLEAVFHEPGSQIVWLDWIAGLESATALGQLGAVRHRLDQGLHGGDQETGPFAGLQLLEDAQPLAGYLIPDGAIGRQAVPGREDNRTKAG